MVDDVSDDWDMAAARAKFAAKVDIRGARSSCAAGATTTSATASVAAIASAASRVRKRRMEITS